MPFGDRLLIDVLLVLERHTLQGLGIPPGMKEGSQFQFGVAAPPVAVAAQDAEIAA